MRYDYNACYLHLKISLSVGIQYPDNDIFSFLLSVNFIFFYIFSVLLLTYRLLCNTINSTKTKRLIIQSRRYSPIHILVFYQSLRKEGIVQSIHKFLLVIHERKV